MTEEEVFQEAENIDTDTWDSLTIVRGQVVEVEMDVSEDPAEGSEWVGLLVQRVQLAVSGEMFLTVRSLGSKSSALAKWCSSAFNRRRGTLHLCPPTCLGGPEFTVHTGRIRLFEFSNFHRPYLTPAVNRMVKKWEGEVFEPEEKGADDAAPDGIDITGFRDPGAEGVVPPTAGAGRGKETVGPRPKTVPQVKRKEREGEPGKREPTPAIDREKLRRRLEETRARLTGTPRPGGAGKPAEAAPDGPDGKDEAESSSPEYSASVAEEPNRALLVGNELGALEDHLPRSPREDGPRETREKGKKKKKKEKEAEDLGGGVLARAVLKGTSTGVLQRQLVKRAAEAAAKKLPKSKGSKTKSSKKDIQKQLLQILTSQRKKKKKERKKKKRPPDGPGSSGGSGSSGSQTASSENSSGEPGAGSSDSESVNLDTPLKKRSKEKPGSVLAMLIDHARQKLDQTSQVTIQPHLKDDPTKGIRLSSYFAIVVRPQLGPINAQVRELHHLSNAIDALRQGDLDLLGHLLASRFMAIHQSMLDGNWTSARHLELLPLEDNSAAGSGILLEARKFAKLSAKLQNQDYWTASGTGRGKGGKGKAASWGDSQWQGGEQKGKTKKGGKGKGKNKGGWQGYQGGSAEGDATKQKEKIPEK
jgi:hypothetical protein